MLDVNFVCGSSVEKHLLSLLLPERRVLAQAVVTKVRRLVPTVPVRAKELTVNRS